MVDDNDEHGRDSEGWRLSWGLPRHEELATQKKFLRRRTHQCEHICLITFNLHIQITCMVCGTRHQLLCHIFTDVETFHEFYSPVAPLQIVRSPSAWRQCFVVLCSDVVSRPLDSGGTFGTKRLSWLYSGIVKFQFHGTILGLMWTSFGGQCYYYLLLLYWTKAPSVEANEQLSYHGTAAQYCSLGHMRSVAHGRMTRTDIPKWNIISTNSRGGLEDYSHISSRWWLSQWTVSPWTSEKITFNIWNH